MVDQARSSGILIETRALLDNPDQETLNIVARTGHWLDDIQQVNFNDLGLTRNAGLSMSKGDYLSFLDGDDLWSSNWLCHAYRDAKKDRSTVWHPAMLYYFTEDDFDTHSTNQIPYHTTRSFFMRHVSSETDDFNQDSLFLNNLWTANVFAHRNLHERFPYEGVDRIKGLGIEDWSWNVKTVWSGIPHQTVDETLHMIRIKSHGSLGQQNTAEGLLVCLPSDAYPRLG